MKKQVRDEEELETYLLRELAVLNHVRHENMLECVLCLFARQFLSYSGAVPSPLRRYIGAYNEVAADGATHAVYIVTELAEGGDVRFLCGRARVARFLIACTSAADDPAAFGAQARVEISREDLSGRVRGA